MISQSVGVGVTQKNGARNDVPMVPVPMTLQSLAVVVIGGLGSLRGAVAGSLLVGFIQTFGAVLAPQVASILIYALLAAVLIFRPAGLFPARS